MMNILMTGLCVAIRFGHLKGADSSHMNSDTLPITYGWLDAGLLKEGQLKT